jgi:hypothetical protein
MKRFESITIVVITTALLLSAAPTLADDVVKSPKQAAQPSPTAQTQKGEEATGQVSSAPPPRRKPVVYKPPVDRNPVRTVGGGSRGSSAKVPLLYVVAPDHVGRTASAQPTLYWYIDRVPSESVRIEFTVLDEDSIEPKIEVVLPAPGKAGLQSVQLADYGANLEPGIEYEWSLALVLDSDERSKDIVATGYIDRVEGSSDLSARLSQGGKAQEASVYAEEGLFYDAIAALSEQVDEQPDDETLREERAELLRQVGLQEVASASL